MNPLLNVKQVSELLRVSPCTVYRHTVSGRLPFFKFPFGLRFKESDVENFAARHKKEARVFQDFTNELTKVSTPYTSEAGGRLSKVAFKKGQT